MNSKLRHPIRAIREPFGTAGLIVACVALIAALGGSALAAKGALTAKQKKEVTKIAKKYAGKPGAPGAIGPQGNPGAAGSNGTNGTNGAPGANGKSVNVGTEAPGANCTNGGVNVTVEGLSTKRYVCNGGFGEEMESGTPLRGNWSGATANLGFTPISVSYLTKFPGTAAPTVVLVREGPAAECENPEVNPGVKPLCEADNAAAAQHCPGSATEPEADPGYVCFYVSVVTGPSPAANFAKIGQESTLFGATLKLFTPEEPNHTLLIQGTWAVTAPEA